MKRTLKLSRNDLKDYKTYIAKKTRADIATTNKEAEFVASVIIAIERENAVNKAS